jgi:hypothetical protein
MKIKLMAAALAVAAGWSGIAAAQDRGPAQFGEKDPIALREDRAYIFFRTPGRTSFRFLREVTPAERAEYEQARQAAFEKAHAKYERRLREWVSVDRSCGSQVRVGICGRNGPRPVEPTLDTFPFELPEADNFVSNAYRPRLIHQEDWSGWLIAVDPGTYALYGEITDNGGAMIGSCYCMGSVKFEAAAGRITDMGEIVAAPADQNGSLDVRTFRAGHYATVAPYAPTMRSPAQFANLKVVPAQLRAADKMPNYYGLMIGRLAPIEGVLGYRRDEVLDLSAGARTASR